MDASRWQQVADVFLGALEREEHDRAVFIQNATVDDELRREVAALLASFDHAGSFLEHPVVQLTHVAPPTSELTGLVEERHAGAVRRFGDYELLGEIARGGMGVVHRARQIGLNRLVALKMIGGGGLVSPALVDRFQSEAKAAANLDHPNIVPIYDVGEHDGAHYFSMRLVEGGNLGEHLADYALPPRLASGSRRSRADVLEPQRRIARLLATIARAVHHAHQRGILHRDLKPGNILIEANGEPLISDFGIAKPLAADGNWTQSILVMGTPSYMSPEQAVGAKQLTTAADTFSLGAILYQLLTQRLPFHGNTPLETIQQVTEQEPPTPHSVNPDVDRDLETVCLKCLNKDPHRRYRSAEALADDLEHWLAGEPITARPVGQAERLWQWCRRKPALATLWLGLIAAILIGGMISTAEWLRAQQGAKTLKENLYVADMSVAFHSWDAGNVVRARELLEQQRPRPGDTDLRTFEWRYLFGVTRPKELLTLKGTSPQIWGSAIAPGGRTMAAGGGDGTVYLWDLQTGTLIGTLSATHNVVYCVAFSPDGTLLATSNIDPAEVDLWDTKTRTLVARLPHQHGVIAVAFSPDGKTLASTAGYPYAIENPAELSLWDIPSRTKSASLSGHTSSAGWLSFSPDGRLLATPQGNGSIILWDAKTRTLVDQLTGHRGLVITARFSPDGTLLATGGLDGSVCLFRVETRRMISVLGVHQGPVYAVAFSPGGDRLASGSMDHTAKLWDVKSQRLITTLRGHLSRVFSVSFSPDGRRLATGSLDGSLKVWDATEPGDSELFDRHNGGTAAVEFSPDDRLLARSELNGTLTTIWDVRSLRKITTIPHPFASFSPDGRLLATSGSKTLTVWDLTQQAPTLSASISLPAASSHPIVFSSDSRRVAVGTDPASTVGIWDVAGKDLVTQLVDAPERPEVTASAFSRDGQWFGAAYKNGNTRLWNATTWSKGTLLVGGTQQVHAIAFSPDSRYLAIGGDDVSVRLWSLDDTTEPTVLRGDTGAVFSLAFTPDSRTLAVGSVDGTVKFWNVRARREVVTLKTHDSIVSGIAFARDGRTMATASADLTMRLWRAPGFDETDR